MSVDTNLTVLAEKFIISANNQITIGSMLGARSSFEDDHIISVFKNFMFICVFDGHNGKNCVNVFKKHLLNQLEIWGTREEQFVSDSEFSNYCVEFDKNYYQNYGTDQSGTTLTGCFIYQLENKNKIQVFNVGDSRTYIIKDDSILFRTKDHKPNDPDETKRINIHGFVNSYCNRICGTLAVSRAFGDNDFKHKSPYEENIVIAIPDITTYECITPFRIAVICDGVVENSIIADDFMEFIKYIEMYDNPAVELCIQAAYYASRDNLSTIYIDIKEDLNNTVPINYSRKFFPGSIRHFSPKFAENYLNFLNEINESFGTAMYMRYLKCINMFFNKTEHIYESYNIEYYDIAFELYLLDHYIVKDLTDEQKKEYYNNLKHDILVDKKYDSITARDVINKLLEEIQISNDSNRSDRSESPILDDY